MTKWEYMIVDSKDVPGGGIFKGKDRADVDRYLTGLGIQGWEIVNLDFRELEGRLEFSGVAKREKGV
ncbi:MAG: hypothetical protein HN849_24945 [Victivallales bacterium]|jgi:hypothetical protein|nr:hypothetical protein [Victivallales bacterium]